MDAEKETLASDGSTLPKTKGKGRVKRVNVNGKRGNVFTHRFLVTTDNAGIVTMNEINQSNKIDVPPALLLKYSDIKASTWARIFTTNGTQAIQQFNMWRDYQDARTYYEATIALFIILVSIVKKTAGQSVTIPDVVEAALTEGGNSNFLTLRLLQDQLMVILVQLQQRQVLDPLNQYFIPVTAMKTLFKSHAKYMTAGLQTFFYEDLTFDQKKAMLWKFRNISEIKESDFTVEKTQLYPTETIADISTTLQSTTLGSKMPVVTGANIKKIHAYHKFIKAFYKEVFLARKDLSLFKENPDAEWRAQASADIVSRLDQTNYPIALYEDLIITIINDMWLSDRIIFRTAEYLESAKYFSDFANKLQITASVIPGMADVPMMNSVLSKIVFDNATH